MNAEFARVVAMMKARGMQRLPRVSDIMRKDPRRSHESVQLAILHEGHHVFIGLFDSKW